jgi:hypothetical protein
MKKNKEWAGYQNAEDYFKNAPVDLIQKHYLRITDFETSLSFTTALMQFRHPTPLLRANQAIYDSMGIEGGE